jgi:hypothetical protein
MVLAVYADNEDDARALLVDSFSWLASVVDFGEVRKAGGAKHGFILGKGAPVSDRPPV